jgi:hypothetical protein
MIYSKEKGDQIPGNKKGQIGSRTSTAQMMVMEHGMKKRSALSSLQCTNGN